MRLHKTLRWSALALAPLAVLGAALPAAAAARSADTPLAPVSHLRIRLSATALITGKPLTATVVVTPRSARIVTFQRHSAHRWRNLASAVSSTTGKVVVRLPATAIGTYVIRATVNATTTAGAGVSPTDTVVVSPVPPPWAGAVLKPGSTGAQVVSLQERLSSLGYWLGGNSGYYGDATIQAVYAFQKAANLPVDGNVGPATVTALEKGAVPVPRSKSGYVIEVNLKKDLVMLVNNGKVLHTLNTSTGGGYTYIQSGQTNTAITPTGVFHINRVVDGTVTDVLGTLWRPRFFYEGYALHGDSYVPAVAVSHGCVRVSNEAIDWIWANNLAPVGAEVWVY